MHRQLALEGASKPYLEGCESMQRVHIAPNLGDTPLDKVATADIEALAAPALRTAHGIDEDTA